MSDVRRPNVYQCPHLETCIFPVDETLFTTHCREVSATSKHPQYEQCQGYQQMNELPRNWFKRGYKQRMDTYMQSSRSRGAVNV